MENSLALACSNGRWPHSVYIIPLISVPYNLICVLLLWVLGSYLCLVLDTLTDLGANRWTWTSCYTLCIVLIARLEATTLLRCKSSDPLLNLFCRRSQCLTNGLRGTCPSVPSASSVIKPAAAFWDSKTGDVYGAKPRYVINPAPFTPKSKASSGDKPGCLWPYIKTALWQRNWKLVLTGFMSCFMCRFIPHAKRQPHKSALWDNAASPSFLPLPSVTSTRMVIGGLQSRTEAVHCLFLSTPKVVIIR